MTLEQTRKLGIEFERRVQTMIPDKEFAEKLDTETIYSYLNQYQDKYIHEIFRNLDVITPGSKIQAHVDSVLQSLLHTDTILVSDPSVTQYMGNATDDYGNVIIDTARSVVYPLNKNFYMYVRSVSNVGKTYSFKSSVSNDQVNSGTVPMRVLPNQLVSQNDLWRLLETPHDSLRILRYPAAVLSEKKEISEYKEIHLQQLWEDGNAYYRENGEFKKLNVGDVLCTVNDITDEGYTSADVDVLFTNVSSTAIHNMKEQLFPEGSQPQTITFVSQFETFFGHNPYYQDVLPLIISDDGSGNGIRIGLAIAGSNEPVCVLQLHSFSIDGESVMPTLYERTVSSVPTLTVIYDQYTQPRGIKVTYYKEPSHFSLMTSTACELPMDAFEELVSGAVDLYVQYVAGAVANKERIQRAREEAAKEAERNNARRNRREE